MLGRTYVIDHCINVINARLQKEQLDIYLTDCLLAIARHTGVDTDLRYYDILHPQKEEGRDAEEIKDDLKRKINGFI